MSPMHQIEKTSDQAKAKALNTMGEQSNKIPQEKKYR